ncbi:hypothetical protein ABKN59_009551 [Abortiporus biennis]
MCVINCQGVTSVGPVDSSNQLEYRGTSGKSWECTRPPIISSSIQIFQGVEKSSLNKFTRAFGAILPPILLRFTVSAGLTFPLVKAAR